MKQFFKNLYKTSRIIIIIIPFVILGVLIKKDLALSGHLEFIYDFSKDSPVITNLFPANRLAEINQIKDTKFYWQQIEHEPVYFEIRLPQKFDTAEVEIVYNNVNQPLIQVGLRSLGDNDWNYNFKPLENQLLNKLDWPKIEDERGTIWQKEKKFLTWDQFFNQVDTLNHLSSYGFELKRKFSIPNYYPSDKINQINKTLRGAHSFYTYIKNETLDFTFTIQDINRKEGYDFLTINVYNSDGQKIYQKKVADDGYISKHDPASEPRNIEIKMDGLAEGVYRIELDTDDEIFFRKIVTRQKYITFINRVYLVDNIEYSDGFVDLNYAPTTIYSTMPRLGFETSHSAGLQTIGLNDEQSLTLSETHKNYYITPQKLPTYIYSPKNDVKIFGRGLMAFSLDMFFNPDIFNLRDYYIAKDTKYLISEYKVPQELNGWKISKVKFDLSNAKIVNRKLRFAISAPELNDANDVIPLKSIKVILNKEPMSYSEAFKKIIKYIRNKF